MTIFRQVFKRIFQNKTRLLVLLIMPLLFIMMFAMQDERSLTIGLVDKDNSMLSEKLTSQLTIMDKVKVIPLQEQAVYDKTVSYQLDYTIIIEAGFEQELISGGSPEVQEFYLNEKEKLFYARNIVNNFIYSMKNLAAGVEFEKVEFEKAFIEFEKGKLAVSNQAADNNKILQTKAAMGFLVQFMLYMSVITAGLILEDKHSRVFYRVFYAPVTLKRYIMENLSAFLLVGILQVTLILGLLKIVFDMQFGSNPMNLLLLFILFSLVCISLGMWIVSIFQKPIGAYAFIIVITTPLVMLGGCYWPLDFMPEILQKIALFVPTTWVMTGVDKILYEGKSLIDLMPEILILVIFSGIFLAAGLLKKVDISK